MPSSKKFKFGNDHCVDLLKKVIIPTELSGRRVNILTVICMDIPLFLSKNGMKKAQDEEKVIKLHRQFCYCGAEKLKDLINLSKFAKTDKKSMIDAVDDITSCDICIKYKKTRPRPAVWLPMASDFNETVAMDFMNIGNKIWLTDLIDLLTWFSVAKTITNKEKNVVTDAIFEIWLSHFGQPRKFPCWQWSKICEWSL